MRGVIAMNRKYEPTVPVPDPLDLRDVLGHFPTGVTIVCSRSSDGDPIGFTVSSFSSVSLEPPLVLFSLKCDSPSLGELIGHGRFAVNVLSESQGALARHFARWQEDKFAGLAWRNGYTDCPLLRDALAHVECEVWAVYEGGDHTIIVGKVARLGTQRECEPLVVHKGQFRRLIDGTDSTTEGRTTPSRSA